MDKIVYIDVSHWKEEIEALDKETSYYWDIMGLLNRKNNFSKSGRSEVDLEIFNLASQEIRRLIDDFNSSHVLPKCATCGGKIYASDTTYQSGYSKVCCNNIGECDAAPRYLGG